MKSTIVFVKFHLFIYYLIINLDLKYNINVLRLKRKRKGYLQSPLNSHLPTTLPVFLYKTIFTKTIKL